MHPTDRRRSRICKALFTTLMLSGPLFFTGCDSSKVSTTPGGLDLRFIEKSDKDFAFMLSNGLPDAVAVSGAAGLIGDFRLSNDTYSLDCDSDSAGARTVAGFAVVDGGKPDRLVLNTGEQRKVLISAAYFRPHAGSNCRLSVKLENGAIVISGEFEP